MPQSFTNNHHLGLELQLKRSDILKFKISAFKMGGRAPAVHLLDGILLAIRGEGDVSAHSSARTFALMMAAWKSYRKSKRRSEELNSLQFTQ